MKNQLDNSIFFVEYVTYSCKYKSNELKINLDLVRQYYIISLYYYRTSNIYTYCCNGQTLKIILQCRVYNRVDCFRCLQLYKTCFDEFFLKFFSEKFASIINGSVYDGPTRSIMKTFVGKRNLS